MNTDIIYNLDCLEGLKTLPDNSVDMVITSPPYFNLRDYGVEGQIGNENNYKDYIDKLILIFDQVYRVVKDGGSCWVNIDDVYSNGSLTCIPDRFKIEMIERGWICRNEIIWHKPNAMPSSTKNRFNKDYEKLFFFTKKSKYYFETQYEPMKSLVHKKKTNIRTESKYENAEQEASVRQGMNRKRGEKTVFIRRNLPTQNDFVNFMRKRTTADILANESAINKSKIEHWFRRDESGFAYPSANDWNEIKYLVDDYSEEFRKIDYQLNDISVETDDIFKNANKGRIKRAVWNIPTKAFKGCHYAPYPEELILTPILACCPVGGIVLDPFMGSGTTAVACINTNRHYIGFDISEKFCKIAEERIEKVSKENKQ